MAPSIGAHNGTVGGTSAALTTTTGSTFVIDVEWYSTATITGVTGLIGATSDGNTYVQQQATVAASVDGLYKAARFNCVGGNGGALHSFTATLSAGTPVGIFVTEVKGVLTSGAIDQAPVGNDNPHSDATPYLSTTTGATTQASEIVVACTHTYTTTGTLETQTWNNGYTALDNETNPAVWTATTSFKVLSATGTQQSSLTSAGATCTDGVTFITTFKASTAAPVGEPLFFGAGTTS